MRQSTFSSGSGRSRSAFTVVELLVIVAVVILLMSILLPALSKVWSTGQMTTSMNNMRQINQWMTLYSSDNNDHILPSRFDYRDDPYLKRVEVRALRSEGSGSSSGLPTGRPEPAMQIGPGSAGGNSMGEAYTGTWTDILTSKYTKGTELANAIDRFTGATRYKFDSPDQAAYDALGMDQIENPFRSTAKNTRSAGECSGNTTNALPTPFGPGATAEKGYPGFFAANDFFRESWGDSNTIMYTIGQIKQPSKSVYLVDSFFGETILPEEEPWLNMPDGNGCSPTIEVDFRYGGDLCLMLFLDGHIDPHGAWNDLPSLELEGIRVRDLTSAPEPPLHPPSRGPEEVFEVDPGSPQLDPDSCR